MNKKTDPEKTEEISDREALQTRRDFLNGLKKWSKVVVGAVVAAGTVASTGGDAAGGVWVNRRGSHRGGSWVNRGGGGWVNRRGGGGWINRR